MNISIISIIISLVSIILAIVAILMLIKAKNRLDILSNNFSDKNLENIIKEYILILKKCENDIFKTNEEFEKIRIETAKFFNKVGVIRYQAFKDTGGDQSFSMALLNQNNDGFILSSLQGRGFSKIYAKEITKGKSESYKLTQEEEQALNQALRS